MKTNITKILVPMLTCGTATSAFAAGTAAQDGGGLLIWLFIGFMALVVMVQAVPAGIMLYSMVKAFFSSAETSHSVSASHAGK